MDSRENVSRRVYTPNLSDKIDVRFIDKPVLPTKYRLDEYEAKPSSITRWYTPYNTYRRYQEEYFQQLGADGVDPFKMYLDDYLSDSPYTNGAKAHGFYMTSEDYTNPLNTRRTQYEPGDKTRLEKENYIGDPWFVPVVYDAAVGQPKKLTTRGRMDTYKQPYGFKTDASDSVYTWREGLDSCDSYALRENLISPVGPSAAPAKSTVSTVTSIGGNMFKKPMDTTDDTTTPSSDVAKVTTSFVVPLNPTATTGTGDSIHTDVNSTITGPLSVAKSIGSAPNTYSTVEISGTLPTSEAAKTSALKSAILLTDNKMAGKTVNVGTNPVVSTIPKPVASKVVSEIAEAPSVKKSYLPSTNLSSVSKLYDVPANFSDIYGEQKEPVMGSGYVTPSFGMNNPNAPAQPSLLTKEETAFYSSTPLNPSIHTTPVTSDSMPARSSIVQKPQTLDTGVGGSASTTPMAAKILKSVPEDQLYQFVYGNKDAGADVNMVHDMDRYYRRRLMDEEDDIDGDPQGSSVKSLELLRKRLRNQSNRGNVITDTNLIDKSRYEPDVVNEVRTGVKAGKVSNFNSGGRREHLSNVFTDNAVYQYGTNKTPNPPYYSGMPSNQPYGLLPGITPGTAVGNYTFYDDVRYNDLPPLELDPLSYTRCSTKLPVSTLRKLAWWDD